MMLAEFLHGGCCSALATRHNLAPLLGIELRAERGGADEIGEDDRGLAPLA